MRDHPLIGDYKDFRECHIKDDLVIVYRRSVEILSLYRIGRHQDIFKGY
ncbi:type II toxin-antitoxin system mRNA interferase toxin, RelE/StbE family [Helicobacter zhangjianzhongii]|uniref:Type II toxin-antitoxin system YafQ family toxin n=1 Tax=Helicobacter zhangjianzhongii TaxID=2974574 RepID=A0ACC6FRM2_9HELI|nr:MULTISPECIES: type II toxin-antitoxin system mRNA interferase toxin, RelE/StbE family [unclassified Helicobacter]MDL0079983.1 type II toxin-antitoxin system YafQ family toxin [Helicobacter sp. CPD2-1]MDL0081770.1 type II toxin-antitoxin system YafQ family toxin [Helicobacter sp. XJK30-2]